jgi:RNA polymerase sigma factor (sigma-70 family)
MRSGGDREDLPAGTLEAYLRAVGRVPLLTAAEERRAAETLRELQVETWCRLLPSWNVLQHVAQQPRILRLRDRSVLEEVARAASCGLASPASVHDLALDLRDLDDDGSLVDGAVAWARALRRGGAGHSLGHGLDVEGADRARRAALTARNALAAANLRLVVAMARRYGRVGQDLMDLVQEGNLGLLKAIHRFDPGRGFRFSTYAHWWVRLALDQAVSLQTSLVTRPWQVVDERRRLARARRDLVRTLGRTPTDEEVAAALGLSTDRVREVAALTWNNMVFLEDVRVRGGPGGAPGDSSPWPDETVVRMEEWRRAREAVARLGPRDGDVLRRRFGLVGDNDETLSEIGRRHHLSKERVRQIQESGMRELRQLCVGMGLG